MHSSSTNKPIALTCGDPNGVGLDLIPFAFKEIGRTCPFFLIADSTHLGNRIGNIPLHVMSDIQEYHHNSGEKLVVLHHPFAAKPSLKGEQPQNAPATLSAIDRAVELTLDGKASAVVTNPINKAVLRKGADFPYPGHTEYLAHLSGTPRSVMMLACEELKVVPVTIHIALNEVSKNLTTELLEDTIKTTHKELTQKFGIKNPKIAVAGLNPHAGEGGMFGDEDIKIILPTISKLIESGLDIVGPLSADTMFHEDARTNYDCAVCMYHDQALIPIKTLDFHGGVNVTLGLPFIRTSPDHGTAYDLAGTYRGNPKSLINAIKLAQKMAQNIG